MRKVIYIQQGITRNPAWQMAEPVNFELMEGEHLAVTGSNGSGKSMFVDILTGRHPLTGRGVEYDFGDDNNYVAENIKYITFRDSYGGDNDRTYFLQQRWNQMEIDPETPTVGQLLDEEYRMTGAETPDRHAFRQHLYQLFQIDYLLDKYVILLSSGEMRKFQLIKALFARPKVLIIDNPFIGLDAQTREQLKRLLETLSRETLQLILILSRPEEIPSFITHVVEVSGMRVLPKVTRASFQQSARPLPHQVLGQEQQEALLSLPAHDDHCPETVVRLNDVTIRYGQRIILAHLNWTVKKGQYWALSGKNGSGKSTLLSLLCADNPQAYACDITLFGHPRGTGESIWDIKRHIGYVSPEMHRAYHRDMPAIRIVASGLADSIGLYYTPNEKDYGKCRWWMELFGLKGKEQTSFLQLSSGEQRLVLLARAFVKDPDLLILDEPLHGLDDRNRQLVKDIIETFCRRNNKTMILVSHYEDEFPRNITHRLVLERHAEGI